jgi:membrane-associated HD superfamily phosphohydrolase
MSLKSILVLLALGFAIWIAGSVYYAYRGAAVLETTSQRYWIAFAVSAISSALLCIAILRWLAVPPASWAPAMLLLAIPGMIGETVVLSHLGVFMPRLRATSGGKYGAFLFATYALVLSIAEAVTLRAGM